MQCTCSRGEVLCVYVIGNMCTAASGHMPDAA
jgi:hypothetical protein